MTYNHWSNKVIDTLVCSNHCNHNN